MRFILKMILIALLTYFAELVFPWWCGAICAFIVCLIIYSRGFISFLSGFLGVGLLWLGMAWIIDLETGSILSGRIGQLLSMNSSFLLIVITSIIGAITGGLGALSGHLFRDVMVKRKRKSAYYR